MSARTEISGGMPTAWLAVRAGFARRLESDRPPGPTARLLAAAWSAVSARQVARVLELPPGVRAIGIGGASLGGSCKTPFAIALARALASRGIKVALVGHAYRALPAKARVVGPNDDVGAVGDDALFAARRLRGSNVEIIVGPSRQSAATFAARRAHCLVFDGLLQARPARLARSILLLDGGRSWHSAHCPPAGDWRAPPRALLRATDLAVVVEDELSSADARSHLDRAIDAGGRTVPLSELRGAAIGLVSAIARPQRLVQSLARRGLHPVAIWAFPDHHRPTATELAGMTARTPHGVDAWLTTGKCATKLPSSLAGAPVLVLDHEVRLSEQLVAWVASEGPEPSTHFPTAPVDALFPTAGAVG